MIAWLADASDPDRPDDPLAGAPAPLRRALEAADVHGVLPAVFARCKMAGLLSDENDDADPGRHDRDAAWARDRLKRRAALSLMLRARGAELMRAMAGRRLAGVILKGSTFADRLYPDPTLRPFSDIDLLVSQDTVVDVRRLLRELDYLPDPVEGRKHVEDYGQERWRRRAEAEAACLLELHWNVVNSPALRRGVSLTFEDLAFEAVGDNSAPRMTSASMLLVAAVHGATSHQFNRMMLLRDIAQLARGRAGEVDAAWLAERSSMVGAKAVLAMALHLSAEVMGDEAVVALARRAGAPHPRWFDRALLRPGVALGNSGRWARICRMWYRHRLKKP